MPFRFRRSIRIAPGLRINIGKSGVSASVGGRGAHVTVGHGHPHYRERAGHGISYRTTSGPSPTMALIDGCRVWRRSSKAASSAATTRASSGCARHRWARPHPHDRQRARDCVSYTTTTGRRRQDGGNWVEGLIGIAIVLALMWWFGLFK